MSVSTAALGATAHTSLAARITELLATRAAWWTVLGGTCVILLVPLFLVDVPPLLDYPNHLARMYVLAFGAHDPFLSRMYVQHWAIIPNLAIDLVLPELVKLLPIYVAGRVMLGVTVLLPLLGTIAYHRVAFGRRSYWPITGALTAYNALFILGFMNFLVSLGLALLVAAGWRRWREAHPVGVCLASTVAAVLIFFVHIFGLVFLALLLAADDLAALWQLRASGRAVTHQLLRRTAMGTAVFILPLLLCFAAPISRADTAMVFRPLTQKPHGLVLPFLAYDGRIDALVGGLFLAGLYLAWRRRHLSVATGIAPALGILLVVYLACPFAMNGTGFIDARFPIMMGLLLFAGLRPTGLPDGGRLVVGLVLALLFIGRTVSVGTVWFDHNGDLADFRRVTASVTPGSRVLVVSVDQQDAPDYWESSPRGRQLPNVFPLDFHLPALLMIEHQAFWPCLFTAPGKQPLVVRAPYDRISVPEGQAPEWHSLVVGYSVRPTTYAPYLTNWQRNFDYVLLLDAGGAGDLSHYLPDRLTLLASADVAALFRIRHPDPITPSTPR